MEQLATVKRIILTYLPAPPHSIGIPVLGWLQHQMGRREST